LNRFRAGKVPPELLQKLVFPYLGAADRDVLLGPGIGRDAALLKVGHKVIVATTDPITGAVRNIGAYALHISANDVATFGVRPRWFLATLLLPEGSGRELLEEITSSMHEAAKTLGVAIVGGHSEVTPGLSRPIVIGFMLGVSEEGHYVTSASAKPGDTLILTKGVAIEGTAILATDREDELLRHLDSALVRRAQRFIEWISVVPEAVHAMSTGAVTAMHDPTEGGVANGLHELADASGTGFIVKREALTLHEETRQICTLLKIDPLNLIASGAMIIAVQSLKAELVLSTLQKAGIPASVIGELVENTGTRIIIEPDGTRTQLPRPSEDALWRALTVPL